MSQQQCPFCQLIENPSQLIKVGETENFFAWLEVNPRARGHTMVVPKEHTENLMELNPGEYQEMMKLVREVMTKAEEGLGADGVSVAMNVKEAGGQMLPHAYVIVFPRFEDEENSGTPLGAIFPHQEELQNELDKIQEQMNEVDVQFEDSNPVEPHPESQHHKKETKTKKKKKNKKPKKESKKKRKTESSPQPIQADKFTENKNKASSKNSQTQPETNEEESDEEEEVRIEYDGDSIEWK